LNSSFNYLAFEILRELARAEYQAICYDGLIVDWARLWCFVGVNGDFRHLGGYFGFPLGDFVEREILSQQVD
tara:strand:+ start:364 stop:579 length:216 start_codon:yes stop_codon:yes gene_type:complete